MFVLIVLTAFLPKLEKVATAYSILGRMKAL